MKKYIYIAIGALVLAGLAFTFTQSSWLKGAFETGGAFETETGGTFQGTTESVGSIDESTTASGSISAMASYLVRQAKSNAAYAETAYEAAKTARNEGDAETLTSEQEKTEGFATSNESIMETIAGYVTEAETDYTNAETAYNDALTKWRNYQTLASIYYTKYEEYLKKAEEAHDAWQEAEDAVDEHTCDEYSTDICYSSERDLEAAAKEAKKVYDHDSKEKDYYYKGWQASLEKATEYYESDVTPAKEAKDEAEATLEKIEGYYEEASQYAVAARYYADAAAILEIAEEEVECSEGYTYYESAGACLDENSCPEGAPYDSATGACTPEEETPSYEYICTDLEILPNSYEMTADDVTVAVDMKIFYRLEQKEVVSFWDTMTRNLMTNISSEATGRSISPENKVSTLSLDLASTGDGVFVYADYTDTNPMNIRIGTTTGENSLDVTYAGASEGDKIVASITGEDGLTCKDSLKITKAAAPGEDTTDTDGDGLTDYEETMTYGTDPLLADSDEDGLTDYEETMTYGTDPLLADSDSDGYSDYDEISAGTDPLDNTSYPGSETPEPDPSELENIIGSMSYTCYDPFSDTRNHWAEEIICRMYQAGIVQGRSYDIFDPDDNITRAEFLKVILKNAGYSTSDAFGLNEGFSDVNEGDWYEPYVKIGENLDVIRTRDSGVYFNPNISVTRADAILYAMRLADKTLYGYTAANIGFSDVSINDYFAYAVLIANNEIVDVPNKGPTPIIEGYENGTFRPYNYITRAESMAMAQRLYLAYYAD